MAENQIYEISRMMRDQASAQKDMRDASALLSQFFQDRYLSKIKRVVDNSQSSVNASPPNEVRLLRALKPFINPDKHAQVDKMIDMMLTMGTVRKMNAELNPDSARESEHADPAGGRGGAMGVFALMALLGK